MVKALHKAGIEVILDVVFNHTGEGNHQGPTISFKGLENDVYYILEPDDGSTTWTTPAAATRSTATTRSSRVDRRLPAVLGPRDARRRLPLRRGARSSPRGEDGAPDGDPPVIWHIELDRRCWPTPRSSPRRGTPPGCTRSATSPATAGPSGTAATATTSAASSRATAGWSATVAVAARRQRRPLPGQRPPADQQHQLHHLPRRLHAQRPGLATTSKHNEANGEDNRDGDDDNLSWNCGVEGDDRRPGDRGAARSGRSRTSPTLLLLSQGVPMIVAGDEVAPHAARQQQRLLPGQRDHLVRLEAGREERRPAPLLPAADRLPQAPPDRCTARVLHRRGQRARPGRHRAGTAAELDQPGLGRPRVARPGLHARRLRRGSRSTGHPRDDEHGLGTPLDFELPTVEAAAGTASIDTGLPRRTTSPSPGSEPSSTATTYIVNGRSIVVLISKLIAAHGVQHSDRAWTPSWRSERSDRRGQPKAEPRSDERSPSPTRSPATSQRYDADADIVHAARRPTAASSTVRLTDTDRTPSWSATSARPYIDATGQMRDMLEPGRYLFAYGIFYPRGRRRTSSRPSTSSSSGAPRDEFVLRDAGLVGQADPPDRRLLLTARSSADGEIDFRDYRTQHRPRRATRSSDAPGDRHDLAPGLRLRLGVPDDRRGPLPRSRREGHRVPARAHALRRHERGHRLLVPRASTSTGGNEQKILASEFGDDYDAIPAYEQIYALAGPTQTYRITGDPRILERHRHDASTCSTTSSATRSRAATSRTSTRHVRSASRVARPATGRARTGTRSATTRRPT